MQPPPALPEELLTASLTVEAGEAGLRLDHLIEQRLGVTRRELGRLAGLGRLRLDGRALLRGAPRVAAGARVELLAEAARPELLAEAIPLPVLLEEERLFFIDKPAGLPVHPGPGHPAATLANALRGLGRPLSSVEGPLRPGLVHRLDRGTSGVMVVAKTDPAHGELAAAFRAHALERRYLALVVGEPAWGERRVAAAIAHRRVGRRAFAVREEDARARPAVTAFRVLERWPGAALVEARPETGRTHQIRVHLAWLGHPVWGDTLYGGGDRAARAAARLGLRRPALHAAALVFPGLGCEAAAPLPEELEAARRRLSLGDAVTLRY